MNKDAQGGNLASIKVGTQWQKVSGVQVPVVLTILEDFIYLAR